MRKSVLKKFLQRLRAIKNRREFKRNSIYGDDLSVQYTSHCFSDNKGDVVIGNHCDIKGTLRSYEGGKIVIGDNFYFGYSSYIGAMDCVTIGNEVIISSNVRIFDNNNHPTSPSLRSQMSRSDFYGDLWQWKHSAHKPVVIEDNVWIGEYSAVLKGVTIGKGSIVASHSIVTKDVPPYSIVAGNPARVVKKIEE